MLTERDQAAIANLPQGLRRIVVEEYRTSPESREVLEELLRSDNPTRAVIAQLQEEVAGTSGLSDAGLGKKRRGFSKLIHKVASIPKAVAKTVTKTIPKVVSKTFKKYGGLIITVVGVALAPFTGGASLAAAAVINAGVSLAKQKKAAADAKKAGKKDAAELELQVREQEAALNAEANSVYAKNQATFTANDVTPERWATLTLDEKLAVIEAISKGDKPALPPSGPVGVPPTEAAVPAPAEDGEAPTEEGAPAAEAAPPPPSSVAGEFELRIEGEKKATAKDLQGALDQAQSMTSTGDRFEILVNGKSTGLKLRTSTSVISVPPADEARVREMSKDDVKSLIKRAEGMAPGGGIPWWLVVTAAGGAAAMALKG